MAKFFIHRPVFAWVLAIVTMLVGAWSVLTLPVEQYPDIAPTTIRITSGYPGATARAVQNSVTTPIEDALTGLDGLLYTESSSSTGRSAKASGRTIARPRPVSIDPARNGSATPSTRALPSITWAGM